jgi:hypothetical protein
LFTAKTQGLHDLIARTLVVESTMPEPRPKPVLKSSLKYEEQYSITQDDSENLTITWEGLGRDMLVKLNEQTIASIPNHKDIMDGQLIVLPNGRQLHVKLHADIFNSSKLSLVVTLDFQKLKSKSELASKPK